MAVPKRRKSKSRKNMRKSQAIKIESTGSQKCPQCGAAKLPHRVCVHCGFYKGQEIISQDEEQ